MTANEINAAVEGVLDSLAAQSPTQAWPSLESIQLRKVREALSGHPTAGPKMISQVSSPRCHTSGPVYCRTTGLCWDCQRGLLRMHCMKYEFAMSVMFC